MKYIVNGKIILPDAIIDGMVLAFDEKICGLTEQKDIPCDAQIIDAKGGYVSPGLVDIHIHGYLGEDTSDGKADGIKLGEMQRVAKNVIRLALAMPDKSADNH